MKIKLILYGSKVSKNGNNPIMLRITDGDKRNYSSVKYIGESLSCHPEYWDNEYGILEGYKHPKFNRSDINNYIGSIRLKIEDIEREMSHKGKSYTVEQIIKYVLSKEKKKRSNDIVSIFNERIEFFKQKSAGNAKVYRDSRDVLIRYIKSVNQKPERIRLADIGVKFLNDYESYLDDNNFSSYTRSIHLRTLRALYNYAIRQEYVSREAYPFGNIDDGKFSISAGTRLKINRYVDFDKIIKIHNLELSDPGQIFARDIFMFSFFCAGMSFTDIARLTTDKISSDSIVYSRKKVKQLGNREKKSLTITLEDQALKIISRYTSKTEHPFIFPILNKTHRSEQQIIDRIHKVLGQVNKSLKEIATKAGITETLSTYTARHSFAVYLYDQYKDINLCKDMLGHASITTTTHYLETLGKLRRDQTTKDLFEKFN